jgi:predicted NBD/HSP70 family sugar kinase
VIRGSRGRPGKIGHLPVTATGPRCERGHTGCVSAYVTAPAIVRNAGAVGFDDAVARARAGDDTATAAFAGAGEALGAAVATIVNLVDPEKVVVTGEGLPVLELAGSAVERGLRDRLDPAAAPVPVTAHEFHFGAYAWAAAITAVRHVI